MNEYRELKEINELIGGCILASACILIILISILEVCQYCKILNYKRSLDDAINKANLGKTLVLNRKQLIASFDASHRPGYAVVQIRDSQKSPSLWLVLLKLKGTMLFSSVVMDYSVRTFLFVYFVRMHCIHRCTNVCNYVRFEQPICTLTWKIMRSSNGLLSLGAEWHCLPTRFSTKTFYFTYFVHANC